MSHQSTDCAVDVQPKQPGDFSPPDYCVWGAMLEDFNNLNPKPLHLHNTHAFSCSAKAYDSFADCFIRQLYPNCLQNYLQLRNDLWFWI